MTDAEWDEFLERWRVLVYGMRDRLPEDEVLQIEDYGIQEPFLGIGTLLGGHEQGMHDLTPEEEDEAWALASLTECRDEDLLLPGVRERSVRNRPIRSVVPRFPLKGGGHGPGRGLPGKAEFPATWSDDDTIAALMDVARSPAGAVQLPTGEFRAWGERQGVLVSAIVDAQGEVRVGYPVRGPGVVVNPLDEHRVEPVARLQRAVDELVPSSDEEPRRSLDELMAAGEWPYVVRALQVLHGPSEELDALAFLARL